MQFQKYSRAEKERFCTLLNKGHSVKELAEQLSIPIANLYRWNALYNSGDTLERHYSPGRKRVLCKEEEKLIETLEETPELSNQDLAAVVDNKIAPSTVSHYLLRQDPPFTRKTPSDEEPIDDNKALALTNSQGLNNFP